MSVQVVRAPMRQCVGVSAMLDGFLELPNLRVYEARPEYLLAMKCAAMRLGEEFRDLDDVRPGGLGVHFIREIMDEAGGEA